MNIKIVASNILACSLTGAQAILAQTPVWTDRATVGPAPRYDAAMAFDAARGVSVLFGGNSNASVIHGDTWVWNGSAWLQQSNSGPSARQAATMTFDSVRNVVVLFGGTNPTETSGETWEWDGLTWALRSTSGPSPRYGAASAFDVARGRVVLFGGMDDAETRFGDTWEWDGTQWLLRTTSGPDPRFSSSMTFDEARGVAVLFGGYTGLSSCCPSAEFERGDTWEWNGSAWLERSSTGPSPRHHHTIAFDRSRGVTTLFGGGSWLVEGGGTIHGDTWEWDGTNWIQSSAAGPSARYAHSMAFDSNRAAMVMFGGAPNNQSAGDLWEYALPCVPPMIASEPPAIVPVTPGTTALLQLLVAGSPATYLWRKDGLTLADNPRISGASSATLTIASVQASDQGTYDCIATNTCGEVTSQPSELSCRPIILDQPPPASVLAPGLRLSVAVPPGASSTYRWRYNGQVLFNVPGLISGATTHTLTLQTVDPSIAGTFDCVLTNACGITTSGLASAYCPADFNQDFNINPDDLGDMINCFFSGTCVDADFNRDGNVDPDDLGDYLNSFFSGC